MTNTGTYMVAGN